MDTKNSLGTFLLELWNNKLFLVVIAVLGLLLPMTPPFFLGIGQYWDNYKYLLMTLMPVIGFGVLFFQGDNPLKLATGDIGWLVFLLIAFASYLWATNGSLIWYLAFGWLGMVLWMLLMRNITAQSVASAYLHELLILIFLAILLHVAVVYFDGQLIKLERWNSHFGYNSNYASVYLLAFFPFLLFYNSKNYLLIALKILSTCLVVLILYKAKARGASLAFLLLLGYFLKCSLSPKYFKWLFISGILGAVVLAGIYAETISEILQKLTSKGTEVGDSHRLYMFKSTLNMFFEQPIVGQGLGNWYLKAYQTDLANVPGFNQQLYYIRLGSHNLFEQLLSELGILGLAAFLFPIMIVVKRGWFQNQELTSLEKAAFGSLLVYLGGSFFYKDANGYEAHFSSLQLLAFVALGILTNKGAKANWAAPKWLKGLLVLLSLMVLGWFTYFYQTNEKYIKLRQYFNWWSGMELMDLYIGKSYLDTNFYKDEEAAAQLLKEIYHPVFKTTHGFYAGRRGPNKSLELLLALLNQQREDEKLADFYFQKTIEKAPFDEEALRKYARYLLRVKKNPQAAKTFAQRAFNIQTNNYNNYMVMIEVAIAEGRYEDAKKQLNRMTNRRWSGYLQMKTLFLAEIAFKEKNFGLATTLLNKLKKDRRNLYPEEVNNLNQQIEQATKKAVK